MKLWRSLILFVPVLVVFVGLTFTPQHSMSASFEEEASIFVQDLAEKAIQELTDKQTPRTERIARFRTYFNNHFAVNGIGKWILGRHWRKASEAEQGEYLKLFEDLMVVSYVDRFAAYVGEPLNIHKATQLDKKNVTVFSDIRQQVGASAVRVNWRVARKGDIFKVVDVIVEGTSMSNTLRSDFGSIIRQRGGKVAGLIEALREKTNNINTEE
jgi:phospholipid transport system substrate-binding protein